MLLGMVAGLVISFPAQAELDSKTWFFDSAAAVPDSRLTLSQDCDQKEVGTAGSSKEPTEYRRYAMLVMANAYPGLATEDLINNYFDPILGIIAPGIDKVNTFGDMRDKYQLWVPNVGGGYNLSKHFSVFLTLGYGAGPVHTKDRALSIFLTPLHLSFDMTRSAFTITPGIDYFPFGMVEQRDYHGFMERIRAIRPMLGARVPWTYAGYKARIDLGLGPFDQLVKVRLGDNWSIWSVNMNVGFDVPITRRNQVNINIGKSFFFDHDDDFGGTVFSVTWKYLF